MHLKKLSTALMLASIGLFTQPAQANLSQQQSAAIVKAFDGSNPADFKQFLGKLQGSDL
ncbi:MAG TPA: dipeptidase, partial [Pseudomonas sp.]|nr:dipeptidase [Pseudomonas sp.]